MISPMAIMLSKNVTLLKFQLSNLKFTPTEK